MSDTFVEAFKNQTFNQDGIESAILKIIYYNPPGLIFQLLAVEEIVKKAEMNRMRNGCILDLLTKVDIQEIVKNGGNVIKVYGGVAYTEFFQRLLFRKKYMFTLRQQNQDEHNL